MKKLSRAELATAVIPAKAGIHFRLRFFTYSLGRLYSRAAKIGIEHIKESVFSQFRIRTPRINKAVAAPPGEKSKWIPAFAGMTKQNRTASS